MRMYNGYFEIKRLEDEINAVETENKRLRTRVELLEEALDYDD